MGKFTTVVMHDILVERGRQQVSEGFSEEHDDKYSGYKAGELAKAAAVYTNNAYIEMGPAFKGPRMDADTAVKRFGWPWADEWWKPKGPRRDLVRAAALIVAEIERLDRSASPQSADHEG
jgi:hypothetical protein